MDTSSETVRVIYITRMQAARVRKKWTQTDLASMVGSSRSNIANCERCNCTPSYALAKRLSAVLGIPMKELLTLVSKTVKSGHLSRGRQLKGLPTQYTPEDASHA